MVHWHPITDITQRTKQMFGMNTSLSSRLKPHDMQGKTMMATDITRVKPKHITNRPSSKAEAPINTGKDEG